MAGRTKAKTDLPRKETVAVRLDPGAIARLDEFALQLARETGGLVEVRRSDALRRVVALWMEAV